MNRHRSGRARLPYLLLILVVLGAGLSCGKNDRSGGAKRQAASDTLRPKPPIIDVLARNTISLMTIRGVTGTGGGNYPGGDSILIVYVAPEITREDRIRIPKNVEGYRVVVQETRAPSASTR